MKNCFHLSMERKILDRLIDEAQTPVAYKAGLALRDGDWLRLARMKVRPTGYCSAEHYLRDAQIVDLLRKHSELPTGLDAKAAARESFRKAEISCYWTNERLNPLLSDVNHYGERIGRIVRAWRKEIRRVLGSKPRKGWTDEARFGPGSTFGNKGELITVADKLDENYTATRPSIQKFSQFWDETAWSRYAACGINLASIDGYCAYLQQDLDDTVTCDSDYATRDLQQVPGSRFTSVKKTALTERGICIEPSLNVFLQLGLGREIEILLGRAYGWRKSDIQEYHRLLARLGSLTGSNATIDLSSASDTVAKLLVKLLLPPRWYEYLYHTRSTKVFIDGKWVRLEKFSSMGNGYTFELETLIFYTLARVIHEQRGDSLSVSFGEDISVFGDDIIVPRIMADDLISALRFFGFEVNRDKTFLDGPFRESCGGDYFKGFDVRPHYIKEEIDAPNRVISTVNGLLRYNRRINGAARRDCSTSAVPWLINQLPRQIRKCRGPEALGDLVITEENEGRWDTTVRNSIRYIRVWRPVANREISYEDHFRPGVVHALALYRAGKRLDSQIDYDPVKWGLLARPPRMVPRIRGSYVSGYRFGRAPYS